MSRPVFVKGELHQEVTSGNRNQEPGTRNHPVQWKTPNNVMHQWKRLGILGEIHMAASLEGRPDSVKTVASVTHEHAAVMWRSQQGVILYVVAFWGWRLRVGDANRLNKWHHVGGGGLTVVSERRVLSKLCNILENISVWCAGQRQGTTENLSFRWTSNSITPPFEQQSVTRLTLDLLIS